MSGNHPMFGRGRSSNSASKRHGHCSTTLIELAHYERRSDEFDVDFAPSGHPPPGAELPPDRLLALADLTALRGSNVERLRLGAHCSFVCQVRPPLLVSLRPDPSVR